MLPVDSMVASGGVLRVPYSRYQIEDAPEASVGVHRAEDPWLAIGYWRSEEPVRPTAIVTPQWRRSSGYFVMERPSPTTQSPTTSVS
jgi:hypothetical protein